MSLPVSFFALGSPAPPAFAHAQTTLAGVVRDPSGGVLPGVTVEASSSALVAKARRAAPDAGRRLPRQARGAALIEKVRSAVPDGSGQYRITELTPGTYTVAYALPGFARVVR